MRKYLALCLGAFLALSLISGPAFATGFAVINGGGTGGNIALGSRVSGSTTITSPASTVDVPVGSLVEVACAELPTSAGATAVTDSAGNTYTPNITSQANAAAGTLSRAWLVTTHDAPIGTTWTCTSASTNIRGIEVLAFSGPAASPFDAASVSPTTGTTTTATIGPTGTLACPGGIANCELIITALIHDNITGQTGLTSGFTDAGCDGGNGTNLCMAYGIFSATTAQSFSTTNGAGGAWALMLDAYKAATGATPVCKRTLLGVGC